MDLDSLLEILQSLPMLILKRIVTVAALLTTMFVSLPAAQGMTVKESVGMTVIKKKPVPAKVIYSKTFLSTNTSPTRIKTLVRRAWYNKEFQWSSKSEWYCFDQIIKHESAWNPWSTNGAGWEETGGIPQAHPSRKMASAGKDYRTNAWTQVKWGLGYIRNTYGSPCNAWYRWQQRAASGRYGWY